MSRGASQDVLSYFITTGINEYETSIFKHGETTEHPLLAYELGMKHDCCG